MSRSFKEQILGEYRYRVTVALMWLAMNDSRTTVMQRRCVAQVEVEGGGRNGIAYDGYKHTYAKEQQMGKRA